MLLIPGGRGRRISMSSRWLGLFGEFQTIQGYIAALSRQTDRQEIQKKTTPSQNQSKTISIWNLVFEVTWICIPRLVSSIFNFWIDLSLVFFEVIVVFSLYWQFIKQTYHTLSVIWLPFVIDAPAMLLVGGKKDTNVLEGQGILRQVSQLVLG